MARWQIPDSDLTIPTVRIRRATFISDEIGYATALSSYRCLQINCIKNLEVNGYLARLKRDHTVTFSLLCFSKMTNHCPKCNSAHLDKMNYGFGVTVTTFKLVTGLKTFDLISS